MGITYAALTCDGLEGEARAADALLAWIARGDRSYLVEAELRRSLGKVRDPRAFGVIGAYDGHQGGVGRIAVDSTWHHFININIDGTGTSQQALKPGGVYAVIDHSGRDGTGTTESQTFHRIEQKVVVDDEKTLHDLAVEAFPGLPYFMFGHSWGSMIARAYTTAHGADLTA